MRKDALHLLQLAHLVVRKHPGLEQQDSFHEVEQVRPLHNRFLPILPMANWAEAARRSLEGQLEPVANVESRPTCFQVEMGWLCVSGDSVDNFCKARQFVCEGRWLFYDAVLVLL